MNKVEMPPNLVAFLLKYYPGGLFYANETFYRYHEGAWEQIEESVDVRKRLARLFGASAEAKVINESVVLLKDFLVISSASLTQHKHLICLRNGTLDTLSYELLPHSPSHRLLNRTDIEWNAEAECPRWIQFLDECFVEDSDKEQKIAFMQEWMGYCLVPDISQQKFVWMVGAGGNGKSVLLSVLERLVGGHNVSHAYMERLGDKFVRAELEGKLLNVSSEMSAEATISDGYFKSIVAGDIIEAERKYKPSFSFRPTVRLMASTNFLPRLLDHSDGFKRRAVIVSFNRQFTEEEQDHGLEGKLVAELSGILAWSVEGLRRLRERGKFDIPESSVVALRQYRQESDPVALFAEERLECHPSSRTTPNELYREFQNWCHFNGYSRMNIITFGKRLKALNFEKSRSSGKDYWLVYCTEAEIITGSSYRVPEPLPHVIAETIPAVQGERKPLYNL